MSAPAAPAEPAFEPARLPRFLATVLAGWWGLFALVLPVTVWDSQVYNVARLRVAEWGGILQNDGWNSLRQIAFPWTFDAVHLPLLWLGFGYSLPSFACFLGILLVVFRFVCAHWGRLRAWWCVAAILGLPTVIYQATSTKNDLAVVFGIVCWFYALWQWWRKPGEAWLPIFGALAVAFAAGSKSSGIPLGALACLFQAGFHFVRAEFRPLRNFCLAFAAAILVVGSIETYVVNQREFGRPLGPTHLVDDHRNRDGLGGALANAVRYFIGNQSLGFDAAQREPAFGETLLKANHAILHALGVEQMGYRADFNPGNMKFLKTGWEAASDYGLLGALALWAALWAIWVRPRPDPLWRIAAAGWLPFLLTAATVAWMPWNARFLQLSFLAFTVVFVLLLLGSGTPAPWRTRLLLLLVLVGGVYAPLFSKGRTPADLPRALRDRPGSIIAERPEMKPILDDLQQRFPAATPTSQRPVLVYAAGEDAWILPVWHLRGVAVEPLHRRNPAQTRALARPTTSPVYLLLLNRQLSPEFLAGWTKVLDYAPERDCALYQRLPAAAGK